MRQSIRGYADGIVDRARAGRGGDSAVIASEVAGVVDVIDGSEDLRRVLSDVGVALGSRRALIDELFGSRVDPVTFKLLGFVLAADRATETVDDFRWLTERFRAAGNQLEPVADSILGHKAAEERVDGYASAVLEEVQGERALGNLEDELFRFQRIVGGSEELRQALSSRDVPAERRRSLVTDLLASKASPATLALAVYATHVGRPRDYEDLLESIVARVASESNRRLAEVRSAVDLDDRQRAELAEGLGRAIGQDVEVRVTVDPSVVAGFVATIGDTVIDGSARHQLELLKERLVMPELNIGERH